MNNPASNGTAPAVPFSFTVHAGADLESGEAMEIVTTAQRRQAKKPHGPSRRRQPTQVALVRATVLMAVTVNRRKDESLLAAVYRHHPEIFNDNRVAVDELEINGETVHAPFQGVPGTFAPGPLRVASG